MTQDVHAQLASAGLIVDGPLEIGSFQRCKAEGDRAGKRSGWYVLHELRLDSGDVVLVGRYGNWRAGDGNSGHKVEFSARELNKAERDRFMRLQEETRMKALEERKRKNESAARRAAQMWARLPDSGPSEYLKRKKVGLYGCKMAKGTLVVPVRNGDEEFTGLQFIDPDGGKRFLTGTYKQGCYHLIGELPTTGRLGIAEGYATAATIHKVLGITVAVAFDAGNLGPVARVLRSIAPDSQIIIFADNDAATPGNPGLTKAEEAAADVGGHVVAPSFESGVAA